MAEVYGLEISTNVMEFAYEKKFPSVLTLGELKRKLELVVGAVSELIKIELRDSDGKFVASLTDDNRSLKELGVKDGMKIHAVDISGRNQDLQDDSMVEKYEMSDEKYNERADSVRMWKKKMLADKETVGIKDTEENVTLAQTMKIGDRCEVRVKGQGSRRGVVAFIGNTQFKDGVWIGIKYDEPVGKNNGSVAGIKYFECDDKYGGFVRPSDVITGDFPELVLAEMDEI